MKRVVICALLSAVVALSGCGKEKPMEVSEEVAEADISEAEVTEEVLVEENSEVEASAETQTEEEALPEELDTAAEAASEEGTALVDPTEVPESFTFVDVFGEQYEAILKDDVPRHEYDLNKFVHDGKLVTYEDDKYYSRMGIDVARHQGEIDWDKVKEQGIEFAFIRLGYRGYGSEGTINLDQRFVENIEGAQRAGLDVGVYFFSQAINEDEALEEAQFVIDNLEGYELQLPVVYDPESILDDEARTDNVTGEQFTRNTIAFCNAIKEKGHEPMVYSNMLWEAFEFNMSMLTDLPFWYADYEEKPQTPYNFEFWQYSNEGRIDGIGEAMDLDIQILKKN